MTNATLNSGPMAAGRRLGGVQPARPTRLVPSARSAQPVSPAPVDPAEPSAVGLPAASAGADLAGSVADRLHSVSNQAGAVVGAWSARLLVVAGLAMIPWLVYLAATLPSSTSAAHWDAVWVGLDTAEAAGLLATGLLLRRDDPRRSLTAAATATLLAVDAWFDCGTAAAGGERLISIAMAAGLELPLAVGLGVLAWRAFPQTSANAR